MQRYLSWSDWQIINYILLYETGIRHVLKFDQIWLFSFGYILKFLLICELYFWQISELILNECFKRCF